MQQCAQRMVLIQHTEMNQTYWNLVVRYGYLVFAASSQIPSFAVTRLLQRARRTTTLGSMKEVATVQAKTPTVPEHLQILQ